MGAEAGPWAAASPPSWNPLDANPPGLVAPSAYFWCSVTHVLCDCDMSRAAKGLIICQAPSCLSEHCEGSYGSKSKLRGCLQGLQGDSSHSD